MADAFDLQRPEEVQHLSYLITLKSKWLKKRKQNYWMQIQEDRISAEADRVEVREQDTCPVCQRYFRSQVLVVRYANLNLFSYFLWVKK